MNTLPAPNAEIRDELPQEIVCRLRTLAHDLSNSLEVILQAAYLVQQSELPEENGKWAKMIDDAAMNAARINHEIRDVLRQQEGTPGLEREVSPASRGPLAGVENARSQKARA